MLIYTTTTTHSDQHNLFYYYLDILHIHRYSPHSEPYRINKHLYFPYNNPYSVYTVYTYYSNDKTLRGNSYHSHLCSPPCRVNTYHYSPTVTSYTANTVCCTSTPPTK